MKLQDIYQQKQSVSIDVAAEDSELIKQIQIRMRSLKIPFGAIDGKCGSATKWAIARFNQAFNETPDAITQRSAKLLIEALSVPGFNPEVELISPELAAIAMPCALKDARTFLPRVLDAFCKQNALTPNVLIAALATISVETGGFCPISEYGGRDYFTEMYEGREDLGNIYPGDGALFHGRGFIQITGRANYRHYGKKLDLPIEQEPNLALTPNAAAEILALYFCDRGVNEAANSGDWERVRRLVNGGLNGWDHFYDAIVRLQKVLP